MFKRVQPVLSEEKIDKLYLMIADTLSRLYQLFDSSVDDLLSAQVGLDNKIFFDCGVEKINGKYVYHSEKVNKLIEFTKSVEGVIKRGLYIVNLATREYAERIRLQIIIGDKMSVKGTGLYLLKTKYGYWFHPAFYLLTPLRTYTSIYGFPQLLLSFIQTLEVHPVVGKVEEPILKLKEFKSLLRVYEYVKRYTAPRIAHPITDNVCDVLNVSKDELRKTRVNSFVIDARIENVRAKGVRGFGFDVEYIDKTDGVLVHLYMGEEENLTSFYRISDLEPGHLAKTVNVADLDALTVLKVIDYTILTFSHFYILMGKMCEDVGIKYIMEI